MINFKSFIKEEAEEGKLKHIHHAEDRPLMHGSAGFEHAMGALKQAHEHIAAGKNTTDLTMKYDGSPSVVFGHHPETGKFFVASKSAFNKNPKINYSADDIEKNHGHAPGLATKLKAALEHLPKVAPKKGVFQGDIMHSGGDDLTHKDGKVSFTPNTITYTAHGDQADKIAKSKFGVVVHQEYKGNSLDDMKATPHGDHGKFKQHKDVWHASADHDTSKVSYSPAARATITSHLDKAKEIHDTHGSRMYAATEKHQGDAGHMAGYINHTVRTGETPSHAGLKQFIADKFKKDIDKVKTEKTKAAKTADMEDHLHHIETNKEHYNNLFKMHGHLQAAKNKMVDVLNQHQGGLSHHIDGQETQPEGFVVNHKGQPTKLVNRAEFSRANLLKIKSWKK